MDKKCHYCHMVNACMPARILTLKIWMYILDQSSWRNVFIGIEQIMGTIFGYYHLILMESQEYPSLWNPNGRFADFKELLPHQVLNFKYHLYIIALWMLRRNMFFFISLFKIKTKVRISLIAGSFWQPLTKNTFIEKFNAFRS